MEGSGEILKALEAGQISEDTARSLYKRLKDKNAPVIDEMHPNISVATRAIYKNFGGGGDEAFNYLQKQNPELTFKKDASGNVLAKKQEEAEWRKLDPSGFDLQDISDIGFDVLAGVGETAASAAGGVAGALGGGGIGAIPAAMAAGGAAGAGFEGARQVLGKALGVSEDVDAGMIGMGAAFGAASPLFLGTGAGAKQITKSAIKRGLTDEAKRVGAVRAQSGLIGRGLKSSGLMLGESSTGIDKAVIDHTYQNLDKLERARKRVAAGDTDYVVADLTEELRGNIEQGVRGREDAARRFYSSALEEIDGSVPIEDAYQPLLDLKNQTRERMQRTADNVIRNLGRAADDVDMMRLKNADFDLDRFAAMMAEEGVPEMQQRIIMQEAKEVVDRLSQKQAFQNFQSVDEVMRKFGPENNAVSAREVFDAHSDLKEIAQAGKGLQLYQTLTDKVMQRAITKAARESSVRLSNRLDTLTGGQRFRDARQYYAKTMALRKRADKIFGKFDPDAPDASLKKTENVIGKLVKSGNESEKKGIKEIGKALNQDLEGYAKDQMMYKYFIDPQTMPVSSQGATSTSRSLSTAGLGAGLGAVIGGQVAEGNLGGYTAGAAIGGGAGALLGGPAATKMYLRALRAGGAPARAIDDRLPEGAPNVTQATINTWRNLMRDND